MSDDNDAATYAYSMSPSPTSQRGEMIEPGEAPVTRAQEVLAVLLGIGVGAIVGTLVVILVRHL
jgi:hypothetical protein